jgi:CheY-like chemotaxis protein
MTLSASMAIRPAIVPATVGETEEARQRLDRRNIDLVFANIHMTPDSEAQDGYALVQRWKSLDPQITLPPHQRKSQQGIAGYLSRGDGVSSKTSCD